MGAFRLTETVIHVEFSGRDHPHHTYAREFKQQVIRATLEPGMSVSIVARRRDINANVVFDYLKQYREGKLAVLTLETVPTVPDTELLSVDLIDSALVLRASESTAASRKGAAYRHRCARSRRRSASGVSGFVGCLPNAPRHSCGNV
ncbi:transposase [Burkholderia cepacia]